MAFAAFVASTTATNFAHRDSAPSWFTLTPDTDYIDHGSLINATGLYLYTITTEIDDGGMPTVNFNFNSTDSAGDPNLVSPFYIDGATGHLMGQQDFWGLEKMYTADDSWEGSVYSVNSQSDPDATSWSYPTFTVDGEGCIQLSAKDGVYSWGWCPDDENVGDGNLFLPGTIVLAQSETSLKSFGCTTFKSLRTSTASAPG